MKHCNPCPNTSEKSKAVFSEAEPPNLPFFDSVLAQMNRLAGKYSFITLSEYGRSVMGKPLLYICAGTGARRVFFFDSHHAYEWI